MDGLSNGKPEARIATTTAGLRGTHWDPSRLPPDVNISAHSIRTHDGASVVGFLMRRGGERTVVCAMHPREMTVPQYMAIEVLQAGCAFWVQGSRSPNNDLRLEHETALLDLASGQILLRSMGFTACILQGISGGGPLAAFYCQQAALPASGRLTRTPGGRPVDLAGADLPQADGVVLISSHLGQGPLLQSCLDPSVVDEADAFATDPALDPFNPANGFDEPPASSHYAPDFVARYRAAQVERVERIDAHAKALLARKAAARKAVKAGGAAMADRAMAAWSPVITVWRTDADLRCWDLALEPSPRVYGSLWGGNPVSSNWGSVGFARLCTPESWLSNWSALSSNATMAKCAPDMRQPVCMIRYTGDNSVYETEAQALASWLPDAERHDVPGNHHGKPVARGEPGGQALTGEIVRDWLSASGFTRGAR